MQVPMDPASQPAHPPSSSLMDGLNFNSVLESPVFAGGLGLAALGSAAALARRGAIQGARLLRRQLLVNVEISKNDPSYKWLLAYLSRPRETPGFLAARLTRIRQLSVKTTTRSFAAQGKNGDQSSPTHAHFALVPGYGSHVVRHAPGVYIMVEREKSSTAEMATGEPHETMTLTTLWAHRHVFEEIFGDAHSMMARATEGKTVVYTVRGFNWEQLGEPRRKRPMGSVILDEGVKEGIVADVTDFIARQEWYAERGIPYRRGYLLFGPPGGGKSSFIHALAGELNFAIATINLSERGMADDKLAMMMQKLPQRTIVLLEDADAAFVNRKQKDGDGYSGSTVTFSGLLNALDGLSAGEERIAFLTTNHIERLDPALIRPGRVDMIVRIGEATRHQAGEMFHRFYGDVDKDGSGKERFLKKLDDMGLFDEKVQKRTSAAAIQGLFLFHKNDMEGAISMAEVLGEPHPTDS
ncbi:Mitochondrial chaperone BCS1 [Cytospora mali]|uniref:Mitochondrial chaperone BCS1 n=1 Tax=Cytospora mali TaxID=578113 RepID=A0A194UY52_CYTMA|nr:Mitochondrial chaperone BCS1 [Valsa mali var. pyri (nom. inval.)]